jgi:hypothetical protein
MRLKPGVDRWSLQVIGVNKCVEANSMISDLKNACVGITSRVVSGGNKHLFLELGSSQEALEQIFEVDKATYLSDLIALET